MKKPYESPKLVTYGRIADCTFSGPHGHHPKGWGNGSGENGGS